MPALRSSPYRLPFHALAALPLLAAWLGFAGDFPDGGLRRAQAEDYAPHPLSSKTHGEFWTYQFLFEGGMQAQFNMTRVNLGSFKDPVCGADLTVMGFKGKNYFVAREYPEKNFTYDAASGTIAVHSRISVTGLPPGAHRISFETRKKGRDYAVELELTDLNPGWVWGDGRFRSGGESLHLFLNIPGARVQGFVAIDGDTARVKGIAWMDHTVQSDFATRLIESGYRLVSQSDGGVRGGCIYASSHGGRWLGYGIEIGTTGVAPKLLKPQGIEVTETSKKLGLKMPTRMTLAFADGLSWRVSVKETRHQLATLDEFGGFTAALIRKYMGGEIFNYAGIADLDGHSQTVFTTSLVKR